MRIAGRGLIDRNKPLSFRFDGVAYRGFAGDTLASALLANDVRLVGRSFKYHRPRGVMSAGSEEPNALVTVGDVPNVRATVQELYDGLEARAQNCWPSVGFDLLSVNDLAAPFLGAGFYYKTFMWPRAFWERVYEPLIRRAAGLGALSPEADEAHYEKAYAFCDLLVIGAGPAGLMAALVAGRAGADVILADEDSRVGGRLLAEEETLEGRPALDWVETVRAELEGMDNVRVMTRTTVTGIYDGGTYGALERVRQHHGFRGDGAPLECFWRIAAKQTVLASGALERPVAFANNDRPGIMTAGAVRAYVNRWGVAPGKSVAVFGNNDSIHRTARDLQAAGIHVAGVIDSRHDGPQGGDYPLYRGAQVCGAQGRKRLESITIRQPGGEVGLQADCLAVSGGYNPSLHLTSHLGARPVWRRDLAAFVPQEEAVAGLRCAGASRGVFSTPDCLRDGAEAARAALAALGHTAPEVDVPEAQAQSYGITALWSVPGRGRAWLDFQNDVTVKDVKQAAQENFTSVEHMKRYTTQGMAPDQGKSSNVAALAVLADATGRRIAETGTTTFRPPYGPVSIAAMAAGAEGRGFAPERLTTSHAATQAQDAPMIEAGLWYRPSYFPQEGETNWRQSTDREVGYVRQSVGVCDVSTLGKIDVQGPDAAAFLDFVYSNRISTLKPGRVRYGLMLREDGFVMDDGTCARLAPEHFLVTTTTAAAGQVMQHLEFVHQCICPQMDVQMISVTEQWAQFAIAGPQAQALLNDLLDAPIADADWPFMACGAVTLGGIAARLFRISFSGERGYELAVPARFGASLFEQLCQRARALGGGPYGMEALNVLRIEKGFITHSEIHGRTTAYDIGMGGMVSDKKDCIGKFMSQRPGLVDPARERLVGLLPVGEQKQLSSGAHLFAQDAEVSAATGQGYITSTCYSPTLGSMLALGFLKHGPERHGEVIRVLDHMRGIDTLAKVVAPVFFDPEGGRLRD